MMTILEKINSLLEERDKAWEERKKLLMQMKKAKSVAERDELFKKYINYGYKIDEIYNKLKFDDKNIEAEIRKNGITIKSKNKHFEVLIPFDVFEKIVEWYKGLTQKEDEIKEVASILGAVDGDVVKAARRLVKLLSMYQWAVQELALLVDDTEKKEKILRELQKEADA